MLKSPSGSLVPMDDEQAEAMKRLKSGAVVKCSISEMRNGAFFRKYWSLLKMAYDMSSDRMQPREHKGHQVLPCFEEFRHDIVILAGYFDVTYKWDGSMRLKAKSLQWSKMDEETFSGLYSKTLDVILQKVLPDVNHADFQRALDQTMAYA